MSEPQIGWGAGLTPDELAAKLKAHPFADVREPLMQRIVLLALREAQSETPVKTGTLRRSETTRVESGGLRGWLGSNLIYAPYVHARVPFFQLGIDRSQAERQRLIQEAGDAYMAELAK